MALFVCSLAFSEPQEGLLSNYGFEVSGDVSFYTQYVWRGILLDRDAVMQPGFYILTPESKFGRIKLGLWSSHDLRNRDNLKSEEYDYIIDYTYDFDSISVSLGHTYYDFVDTDTFSREFYVGLAFPKIILSPSVYFYRDYGRSEDGGGEGSYTVINLAYSMPLKGTPLSLDLSGHVGFNHELFINGDGQDIGLKIGLSAPLTKNLSFSPSLNYSIPLGDLSHEDDGNQKERFFAGGTFVYAF
jgi:hypothetical protein